MRINASLKTKTNHRILEFCLFINYKILQLTSICEAEYRNKKEEIIEYIRNLTRSSFKPYLNFQKEHITDKNFRKDFERKMKIKIILKELKENTEEIGLEKYKPSL